MTSASCEASEEGNEIQLEDSRDGNKYWVGKMKDGKCWMLQNLALGDSTKTISLTSSNSNVTNSWTLLKASTNGISGGSKDDTGTAVWNFGKWVLATLQLMTNCGGNYISIVGCVQAGFVDVSDSSKFESTFTAKTMAWNGANATTNETLVAINCTSWSGSGTSKKCTAGTYDAHYLIGNYYQWNAATAGTGGSITDQDASGSICPKGWKLPTSNTTSIGSFAGLLGKYGVDSNISGSNYNIAGSPLSFVRSGYINPSSFFNEAGQDGYYWSSRAGSSSSYAYYLSLDESGVYPSNYYNRYYGYSVRCIAE